VRPGHLAVPGENLDRLGLIRRTTPITTSATPMINIGRKSVSHPAGQWIKPHQLFALTLRHPPLALPSMTSTQIPVPPTG